MIVARRLRDWTPAIAVAIGFILFWQAAVQVFNIQRFILPAPFAIGAAFGTYFSEIWAAASYTAGEAVGGLVIGVVAGIGVGLLTARWTTARESLMPFAIALNSIPIIAFAPI